MPGINFKTAFRILRKNKTFYILNIFGLALGIACAGLIFLWVEDEKTFDDVHVKKDRLYRLNVNKKFNDRIFTMGSTPRPMAAAIKSEIPGIANTTRASDESQRALFSFDDKALYVSGRFVDASIFSMFSYTFVQGNAKTAFASLNSLVITENTAKKFFGNDPQVIGKTLKIDNEHNLIVTGVLKDLPDNATMRFEWLAPYDFDMQRDKAELRWDSYGPYTYVELEPNADPAAINKQLANFIHRKESEQQAEVFLFPMSDWRLYNEFENGRQTGGGRIKQVRMLTTIAWIILLIACINFMNLATAGSQKRAKEVGVRKVLGAAKKALVGQFIGETLLMSLIAALVAVAMIWLFLPAYNQLMQKQLSLQLNDPVHIGALLIVTLICGLVAGSYPSLYLSSFNPVFVLKGLKMKPGSAAWIRKGLVVLQFTVSVIFIISTIIVYQQIQHVKDRKLGFDKEQLMEIDLRHRAGDAFPLISQDMLQTGLVQNIGICDRAAIRGGNTDNRFKWQGKPVDQEIQIAYRNVSASYMNTLGMQMIAGRPFHEDAVAEASQVIITESMEKLLGEGSAVGKIIQSPRGMEEGQYKNLTVVGVVNDYVHGNVYGKPGPVLFYCNPTEGDLLYVRLKPNAHPDQLLSKIEAVMKKHNPAYPLEYKFVDDQFDQLFQNEVLIGKAAGIFATLAIIISCLGLFGLAAYTAERRIKEIGVRKVLGASITNLAGLLSKDFLRLVMISCLIAFPVAWYMMHDWLQNYEYRITMPWWVFIAAGLMAVVVALITVSTQAIKGALANPVKTLKTE